jgi:hypothetical protein
VPHLLYAQQPYGSLVRFLQYLNRKCDGHGPLTNANGLAYGADAATNDGPYAAAVIGSSYAATSHAAALTYNGS